MSVVKINAITVPAGAGTELERRFAARARSVEGMPGFEEFQLLRPTDGSDRYFVYTRWDSEESFHAWVSSQSFTHGHATAESTDGKPVSMGAELLSFAVVELVAPGAEQRLVADSPVADEGRAGGSSSSF